MDSRHSLMAASKSEVAWRTSPEDVGEIWESKTLVCIGLVHAQAMHDL